MRTSLRATIAMVLALGVLLVAAVAGADTTASPPPAAAERPNGGGSEPGDPGTGGGAAGTCLEGVPDCVDTVVDPDQPCGVEVVDGTGPDGTVSFAPCPGEEPPTEPEPAIVEPRSGMTNVYPRPFDTATVSDDGLTVTIDFWSGVEPCYVLDHVDVAYGDAVIITLFEGSEPTDEPVACIEIAVMKRVVITLDEPLGDRPIIDGAAPEEPAA